jgi:threonine aldolase
MNVSENVVEHRLFVSGLLFIKLGIFDTFGSEVRKIMDKIIDLRSDTVTRPSPAMLQAMLQAVVGDDVFEDDPTVNALESHMAGMFGMEAALFCPSGTMTNQIAIKAHTQPGEEVICDTTSHVYNYEGAGIGFNSGCSAKVVFGDRGRFKAHHVTENINPPDNVHYPVTRLVVAENTNNKGGGSIWDFRDLEGISTVCRQHGLKFHLDGARLFNALAETKETPVDYGRIFDSISICFSKGLGAPVGSILLGSKDLIRKGRRIRKVFGGGMRQSGYLAAAAQYAVDHNVDRLKEDHRRAKALEQFLFHLNYVSEILPVQTNIVIFKLADSLPQQDFIEKTSARGLWVVGFGPQTIRLVTHLDYTDEMLQRTIEILGNLD